MLILPSRRQPGSKEEKKNKNHSRDPALIFIGNSDDTGRRHASHRSGQAPPTSKTPHPFPPTPPQTSVGVARQEGWPQPP